MLVVCPTPIGNLDDATPRQREALGGADVIVCEDTRRTGKLLELLGIERRDGKPRLVRYDDHTADEKTDQIVTMIAGGDQVVLVSDAGTPTISDPGFQLVRQCRRRGLEVVALPGPVAALVALSGSGLPTDRFFFEGFLPTKQQGRRERIGQLDELAVTALVYVSVHRVVDVLEDLEEVLGADREICLARELTKMHEEYLTGSVSEVRERIEEQLPIQGELVLCISPAAGAEDDEDDQWAQADRLIRVLDEQNVSSRTIKEVVSELCDVPRSAIYDRIQEVTE